MLYAIVSDVHANLPAWRAVLADLISAGAGRIICLGDVVGYGPEPAAVLASMHRHVDAFVMGNHDAALCGKLSPARFNSYARAMIEWSAGKVSRRGREFLAAQSLVLQGPGFTCVHGDLEQPAAFHYLLEPLDANGTWAATHDALVFVGHSHLPGLFVRGASGLPHLLAPQDFLLEEGKRFIVNVGSVGYPRDGDSRACYCLFSPDEGAVRWRRVPFDMQALRDAMRRERLDEQQVPLLDRDPVRLRQPVREQLQFDPAADSTQMAQGVAATHDLAALRRRGRRWRLAALAGLAAAALAGGAAVVMYLKWQPPGLAVPADPLAPHDAAVREELAGNLVPPWPLLLQGDRLGGWRYSLFRPRAQRLEVILDDVSGAPRLRLTHARRALCRLEAPAWRVHGLAEGKLRTALMVRRGPDFEGQVTVVVDAEESDRSGRPRVHPALLHAIPAIARKDGWEMAQATTARPLDDRTHALRYRIEADFAGTLELAEPSLTLLAP
ncbi:MAG: metallophosphoesterase family protein [Kiritimatiellae bacterium]|nr:metallophosphoesterase family protein [Kiritimatiellia bacterium]